MARWEKAVVLEPRNPFGLHTLGQLHLMKGDAPAALPHLRAAAAVAADDPIIPFTHARCLLQSAASHTKRRPMRCSNGRLRLAPVGELAEQIKT